MADPYERLRNYPLNVVLAGLGFETFKYRKQGTEGYGACPIHGSKSNTTCFSFDDDGRFNCFSCSAKGKGSLDLVMAVRKCGFKAAVAFLEGIGGTLVTKPLEELNVARVVTVSNPTPTENPVFKGSYEKYAVRSEWLESRGLSAQTCQHFDVFQYDNPKRKSAYSGSVMLKIRRWRDGECVGYLVRNIGEITPEKPKYVFPKGVSKGLELFGAWQIKNEASLPLRVVYLVESPFAVLRFHQLGLPAVSPFGWCVSPEQVAILGDLAKGCIYLPDRGMSNEIGNSALSISRKCWVKCPMLPDEVNDPEHLSAEQILSLT